MSVFILRAPFFAFNKRVISQTYFMSQSEKLGKTTAMNSINRNEIKPGLQVAIVLKQDQRSGKLTKGIVKDILTKSPTHPHGIKVRLESGAVGRVKEIV